MCNFFHCKDYKLYLWGERILWTPRHFYLYIIHLEPLPGGWGVLFQCWLPLCFSSNAPFKSAGPWQMSSDLSSGGCLYCTTSCPVHTSLTWSFFLTLNQQKDYVEYTLKACIPYHERTKMHLKEEVKTRIFLKSWRTVSFFSLHFIYQISICLGKH